MTKEFNLAFVSREQDRRQPLAPLDRRLVRATPGLEELYELLACAVVVPLAVALHNVEQMIGRIEAIALGVQRHRKVEPRLVVERVRRDLLLELGDGAERLRLLGKIDR